MRFLFLFWLLASVSTTLFGGVLFTSTTSTTIGGLQPAIDAFRNSIGGGTVAGANGSFGGVRREINWDGVPNASADPSLMPATFFVNTSPRGLGMSGPVTGFMVSANSGQAAAPLFESFDGPGQGNGTYDFQAFSSQRIFSGVGGTDYDFSFFIPGTGFTTPSFTLAIGIVFLNNTSQVFDTCGSIQAFNGNQSLASRCADAVTPTGYSFLGVTATGNDVITKITVHQGNLALGGAQDATHRFVPIDDVIYAEPGLTVLGTSSVPEPGTWAMATLGVLAAALRVRRRRV